MFPMYSQQQQSPFPKYQRQKVGVNGRWALSHALFRLRKRLASAAATVVATFAVVGMGDPMPEPPSICILMLFSLYLLASSSTSSTVGFW